jgi:hypothetical protein
MFGQWCEPPFRGRAPRWPGAGGLFAGVVVVVPLLEVLVLLGVVVVVDVDVDVAALAIAAPPAANEPVMASVVSRGLSLRIIFTSFRLT